MAGDLKLLCKMICMTGWFILLYEAGKEYGYTKGFEAGYTKGKHIANLYSEGEALPPRDIDT